MRVSHEPKKKKIIKLSVCVFFVFLIVCVCFTPRIRMSVVSDIRLAYIIANSMKKRHAMSRNSIQ